jgi:hypothetical protein
MAPLPLQMSDSSISSLLSAIVSQTQLSKRQFITTSDPYSRPNKNVLIIVPVVLFLILLSLACCARARLFRKREPGATNPRLWQEPVALANGMFIRPALANRPPVVRRATDGSQPPTFDEIPDAPPAYMPKKGIADAQYISE